MYPEKTMFSANKIADYKQYQLWSVESDDNEVCYIRIKEKNAREDDDFILLLQTTDCNYKKGDKTGMQSALLQVQNYIDTHLAS